MPTAATASAARTETATLQVIVTGDEGSVSVSAGADCDITQTRNQGQSCLYPVTAGQEVTLRPAVATGFVGWSVFECPGLDACTIKVDSDQTVVATFTPTSLTIAREGLDPAETVTSSDRKIACPGTCSSSAFDAFAEVTLTAAPAASFDKWSGACQEAGSAPTCTLLLSGDDVVGAKFKDADADPEIIPPRQKVLLKVAVEPQGAGTVTSKRSRLSEAIDCGALCKAHFEQGETATLTATAARGARFAAWRGTGRFCVSAASCRYPAFGLTSVEAVFELRCLVPKVVGLRLGKAKQRIAKAHCRTGKVTRKRSSRKKKGKVLAQRPAPGKDLKSGAKVRLTVGKGPKRR
jgi:PASTA domain/Divergent InlB B-repeat domain